MDVKQAVQTAKEYITSVFEGEDISGTRLEEVDYVNEDDAWKVTFSFLRPTGTMDAADRLLPTGFGGGQIAKRDYKVVTVDDGTGQEAHAGRVRE